MSGLTALACLVALVSYLGSGRAPDAPSGSQGRTPVSQPSGGFAAVPDAPWDEKPSPGLRPREQPTADGPADPPAGRATGSDPGAPKPATSPPAPRLAPPTLTVTRHDVPDVVDLTAGGGRDWAHWGLRGGDSVVRKRGGTGEIIDEGGQGYRGSYDSNPESFRWIDGTPVASSGPTPTGVYTCGRGNGFALAVAGSGETRTAQLYAGLWMARGRLDVRLTTGGPTTTLRMEDRHTNRTARFEIRFRVPRGEQVKIRWITEVDHHGQCGNVDLQAVTVS
ncbi:hypothetical protein E1193_14815 [Micromonospora sp. KC606]|nr:hypothetical protein E1193_14815 [Micromonospora sp. KC606]